jgi:hypothetical protein
MPWSAGVEKGKETEKEEVPHKVILGKEIVDHEWDGFMSSAGGPARDGDEA